MKIPGLCFNPPTTKFTLFWDMEDWNLPYFWTNKVFMTLLLLPVLSQFSQFCQFSIVKIQKWGSVTNRGRVPWVLGQIPNYTKCNHCPQSIKDWGTLPLFDTEPHFWIFAMLNWQNHEKWGKTGKSRLLENHLLCTRNFKNGILSS